MTGTFAQDCPKNAFEPFAAQVSADFHYFSASELQLEIDRSEVPHTLYVMQDAIPYEDTTISPTPFPHSKEGRHKR